MAGCWIFAATNVLLSSSTYHLSLVFISSQFFVSVIFPSFVFFFFTLFTRNRFNASCRLICGHEPNTINVVYQLKWRLLLNLHFNETNNSFRLLREVHDTGIETSIAEVLRFRVLL